MKRFGKLRLVWGAALLFCAACSDDHPPLGVDETGVRPDPVTGLTRLTCAVDVAARSMSCDESVPGFGAFGASADLIVGSQHQFVRMANDTPQVVGDTWTANVTVQNLTLQPMGTTDGTTPAPAGVRVFFVDLPSDGVVVSNADGSASFTGSDPQLYYEYSGGLLGSDEILSQGEVSSAKTWEFTLNGATTFRFSVLISTDVPDEAVYGVHLSDVSAGQEHTCGDGPGGTVYCWGTNDEGRLGDGTDTTRNTPTRVSAAGAGLSGVAAGGYHTCADGDDGNIYCWGTGWYGQLGNNTSGASANSTTPVQVLAPLGVTLSAVTSGEYHSCALGSDDNVYCWGRNSSGQLGNNSIMSSSLPVAVAAPVGVALTSVSAGSMHTCAIGDDGSAYCWGSNGSGQLGDSTTVDAHEPVRVHAPDGVEFTRIAAGWSHTCAISTDNDVYCWGANGSGQLGNNSTTPSEIPVAVATGVKFTSVDIGNLHTCGVSITQEVYCWGANDTGQIGNRTLGGTYLTPTRTVDIVSGLSYSNLDVGFNHACAIGSDGKTYCWGQNTHWQLGDGRESLGSVSPIPVAATRRP